MMANLIALPQLSGGALDLALYGFIGLLVTVLLNAFRQLTIFRPKTEPPAVFHWIPYIGNAISYGSDPVAFFVKNRAKYGDVFTFKLFGRKITCYLGVHGNEFILNGKLQDVNAEEIYGPLTTPVFGKDVIYDCPNSKLMEQKKFVKFGLTQRALESHVPLIEKEVLDYLELTPAWKGASGQVDISLAMSEITLFTAARSLQGEEVRQKLTGEFAKLYHDLDDGFRPVNFIFPWLPLPQNRRRDNAHNKMRAVYEEIISRRRAQANDGDAETDMIWNLMNSTYKDGTPVPDSEVACMMITLLMGGQHSSASASAWIMLRLAAHPNIAEELYQEQLQNLTADGRPQTLNLQSLSYSDLDKLPLLHNVVKETLRLHGSIHSILRKVMNPLAIPDTPYIIHTDKVLLSSPMVTATSEEYFPDAKTWNPHRWDDDHDHDQSVSNEKLKLDDDNETIDYGYGAVARSSTRSPYIPFGAGRHRCIGEKFAYLNLKVIVATVVRYYKLGTVDGGVGVVPGTDHTSMFARPVQPAFIRWVRREEA